MSADVRRGIWPTGLYVKFILRCSKFGRLRPLTVNENWTDHPLPFRVPNRKYPSPPQKKSYRLLLRSKQLQLKQEVYRHHIKTNMLIAAFELIRNIWKFYEITFFTFFMYICIRSIFFKNALNFFVLFFFLSYRPWADREGFLIRTGGEGSVCDRCCLCHGSCPP